MLLRSHRSIERGHLYLLATLLLVIGLSLRFSLAPFVSTNSAPVLSGLPGHPGHPGHPGTGNRPLSFEPNVGQSDGSVRFLAHAPGGTLYFTTSGVVLYLNSSGSNVADVAVASKLGSPLRAKARGPAPMIGVRLEFVGPNTAVQMERGKLMPGRVNYIKGAMSKWHTNLPTYDGIVYSGLYPGIDLTYEGVGGELKGTYTVSPGGDPSVIRWRYTGAQAISLDGGGNLQIAVARPESKVPGQGLAGSQTDSGLATLDSGLLLTEAAPVAWQEIEGQRTPVSVAYKIDGGGNVSFALGAYDHSEPLTIDPTIIYSTYLGGYYGDGAESIWLDGAGNIFVGGTTSSSDFPVAGSPFQPVYGGGEYDMFASKLTPDGSSLIYSTFIGGGDWDVGGLAGVDAAGVATLGGWTSSDDFPTTPGAFQTVYAGTQDVAVARLSADGSDLIFGSYWGDAGVEESYGFAVDGAGNTYFTGYYFPGRSSWAFLAALSPDGSQQLFRRNLGGAVPGPGNENANTSGEGLVVDGAGNIYLTGYTRAADFPTTPGAYRTSIQAFEDGFAAKLSPMGQSLIYSTYIPGGVSEYPFDVAIDQGGNSYITGYTSSSDFPTTPGAFQTSCGDPRCAFVTKLNAAGSTLAYSTFLGGPDFYFDTEDYGFVVRVNLAGNAYVGGYTSAPDFPVVNPIQPTLQGPYDGFLTKFNPSGSGVEYSTYLGGSSGDSVSGIALDGLGHVYLVGSSTSNDFPVVDPLQPTNHGGGDAIVVVIAEEGAVTRTPTPTPTGTPPTATATSTPSSCGGITPWRTETPMNYMRARSGAAVVNDKLYVVGGDSIPPAPGPYALERFDPGANTWTPLAPAPYPVGFRQAVGHANKVYTIGSTYSPAASFLLAYDTASNTWARSTDLPVALLNGAMALYNGKIYVIGGQVANQFPSNRVFEYDPDTGGIAEKAPMPSGQAEVGAAAVGNRIYVAGGYQYIHYAYDPAANSWSTIAAPLAPSFSFPAVFAFNGELWVVGGYDNLTRRGYPPGQEVQIYNPSADNWRYGPALNQPRYYSTAGGVIGSRAYLVGGIDLESNSYPYDYLNSAESIAYQPCGTATATSSQTPVSTATGTNTPVSTATRATGTPPATGTATRTATRTATPCPITFSDVHPSDYFYEPVRYLYCRGVISGYSDNTFRPYNNTTRGQMTKIVVLAFGYEIYVPSTPTFSDVPTGHPFFAYVETAAFNQMVSGYSDGTFRPFNDVTRGQLCKVVVVAAGWPLLNPPTPTFTDVPTGHPFYTYIETAYDREIIAGYSDNTFRPLNNATRGQICRIIYNAVTR